MKNWGYVVFEIRETREAKLDLKQLAAYMIYSLKNGKAASNFLDQYKKQIQNLATFPFGYREIGFKYQGYEIRMKPFSSYNIFFVVDAMKHQITILRVLKNRQDWRTILHSENQYSF